MSPLVLVAIRFTISGSLIVVAAWITGNYLPRGRELWITARNGILVLAIGNGALAFAEQWIPSGLAALFITISPFWLIGIEALVPGGERLHAPTIGGMMIGLAGAALLVSPAVHGSSVNHALLAGFLTLQLGCAGWSLGSILQKRQPTLAHPAVSGGIQQLATGVAVMVPALLTPGNYFHWSARGVGAVLYLVTFGSLIGYSAYIYAMDKLPVALVSVYNYINPVVAVALGLLFYREPFGRREAIAMAIIFAGVAIVRRFGRH
jgi:drug/metabolite transporter (DMT)-like permease